MYQAVRCWRSSPPRMPRIGRPDEHIQGPVLLVVEGSPLHGQKEAVLRDAPLGQGFDQRSPAFFGNS